MRRTACRINRRFRRKPGSAAPGDANEWLKPIAAACDYECVNALFSTTIEQWPGPGVSWSGKRRLKVFSLRSDSLIEDSIAEGQWGLKPIAVACDYDGMNTFFSTTTERWRIERFIPYERNAPDPHLPWYPRAHRTGPRQGERQLKVFSVRSESPIRTNNCPNGSEALKEILTPRDKDNR
jgi:hypothetical protein